MELLTPLETLCRLILRAREMEAQVPAQDPDEDADFIAQAMPLLPPPPYTDATWGEWTAAVKDATGRKGKGLFMPLRKAVTGQAHGPDMAQVMPLLQVVKARR